MGVPSVAVAPGIPQSFRQRRPEGELNYEWHRVVMFGRLAEIAAEYLKKGRQVYIEGQLRTRKWQGQDGQDRYTTEVIAREMQMLGGRNGPESGNSAAPQTVEPRPENSSPAKQPEPSPDSFEDFDDIPF